MRIHLWIFSLLLASNVGGAEIHFNFSETPDGAVPTNFVPLLAGNGQPGVWKIIMDEVAPMLAPLTPQAPVVTRHGVLAQTSADPTDEHFPMLLFNGEKFRNFKFTTRFKLVSGVTEQMAGMVFRYQNSSNYYVVRASALGKNVRFYKVVDGIRSDPIGPDLDVTAGVWHTLAVQCDGTQISIWFNDKLIMPALGDNSLNVGLVGFRTKSDAVAYFTDAVVDYTPLIPAAQAIVNSVAEKQKLLLGLRIYRSQWVAGAAAMLLAIPPVLFTLYSTISLGGYGEMLLLGNLCLLLALPLLNVDLPAGRGRGPPTLPRPDSGHRHQRRCDDASRSDPGAWGNG